MKKYIQPEIEFEMFNAFSIITTTSSNEEFTTGPHDTDIDLGEDDEM